MFFLKKYNYPLFLFYIYSSKVYIYICYTLLRTQIGAILRSQNVTLRSQTAALRTQITTLRTQITLLRIQNLIVVL